MCAALNDLPAVEHHDLVAVANRAQAMRHDQAGAAPSAKRLVDRPLGQRVERAGRFVEHEQHRITGQGARDLQALKLAAAEVAPTLFDDLVVAARPRDDLGMDRGVLRRPDDGRLRMLASQSVRLSRTVPSNMTICWSTRASELVNTGRGMLARGRPSNRIWPAHGS